MTTSAELVERTFAELEVGMSADEELAWDASDLETFAALTGDSAPVHRDETFARELGFDGPIVYGLLAAAPFSRILGCQLPGVFSVIQSLRFDFAQPVTPGETLRYRATVSALSASTRSVVLELRIEAPDGGTRLRDKAQCGMLR